METINNVAAAAAKAVWGESETNKEPVSGAQGDSSKGEPFDAGNMETDKQSRLESDLKDTPSHSIAGESATGNTTGTSLGGNTASHTTSGAGTVGSSASTGAVDSADTTAEAKPTAAADSTSAQNDIRRPEDASANEDVQGQERDQPGPQPLGEVAKEKGGDAGNSSGGADKTAETSGGDRKADEKDSKAEGTGEKWVKTTGFKADGGDFDATKPGAGREADRLMEEKGIHKDKGSKPTDSDADKSKGSSHDSKTSSGDGEKQSLGDKIKAKLHKS